MMIAIVLLGLGLVILISGAQAMVAGSASMARKMGISPIIVGLTVVSFGTSAPELIVNIFSALRGSSDIAIGNVVGSNISNILLILGIAAVIRPLSVKLNTTWREIPFGLLAIALVFVFGNDGIFDNVSRNVLSRTDGIALISLFILFMYYVFGLMKAGGDQQTEKITLYSYPLSTVLVFGGLAGLFFGGKVLVDNAVILARIAGLSEAFIGLTVVALGTSLPELATSVVAVIKGHDDIAVGNVVGSNIFNVFFVLGVTSTILPLPFGSTINMDVFVAVAATFLLFMSMFVGRRHTLDRWQGVLFVMSYVGYIAYLIMRG